MFRACDYWCESKVEAQPTASFVSTLMLVSVIFHTFSGETTDTNMDRRYRDYRPSGTVRDPETLGDC